MDKINVQSAFWYAQDVKLFGAPVEIKLIDLAVGDAAFETCSFLLWDPRQDDHVNAITSLRSFDHLVCNREHGRWNSETESFRRLEIDDEFAGGLYSFIGRDTLSRDMGVQLLGKANSIIVGAFPIYRSLVHFSNSLAQGSSNRLNSDQNDCGRRSDGLGLSTSSRKRLIQEVTRDSQKAALNS